MVSRSSNDRKIYEISKRSQSVTSINYFVRRSVTCGRVCRSSPRRPAFLLINWRSSMHSTYTPCWHQRHCWVFQAGLKHCSSSTREEKRETRTMSQEPQSQKGLAWSITVSGNTHPHQAGIARIGFVTREPQLSRRYCAGLIVVWIRVHMEDENSTGIVAWTDNLLPESIGLSLVPLMTPLLKYCSL